MTAIDPLPPLPLESWRESKETLHRFAQIVGKVRLAGAARASHWWGVPLYPTARGVTTSPIRDDDEFFEVVFDFRAHQLLVEHARGDSVTFSLPGLSVADFHARLLAGLRTLGIGLELAHPYPFDLDDARPFAEDVEHASYDPAAVRTYWRILLQADGVLKDFTARFSGKASPVSHWWHTFDLAVSRFSGRRAELPAGVDAVTREAYSHEVIASGFWFGDDSYPAPAFYSYTAPAPPGLADEPLSGPGAGWHIVRDSPLAILPYEDVRAAASPRVIVLDFLESAYQAGAKLAGWDVEGLRSAHAPATHATS